MLIKIISKFDEFRIKYFLYSNGFLKHLILARLFSQFMKSNIYLFIRDQYLALTHSVSN